LTTVTKATDLEQPFLVEMADQPAELEKTPDSSPVERKSFCIQLQEDAAITGRGGEERCSVLIISTATISGAIFALSHGQSKTGADGRSILRFDTLVTNNFGPIRCMRGRPSPTSARKQLYRSG